MSTIIDTTAPYAGEIVRPLPPEPEAARPEVLTADTYVIEVRGEAAGIVARDAQGFCFYACSPRFNHLEGTAFASPREAERAAVAASRRGRAAEGVSHG